MKLVQKSHLAYSFKVPNVGRPLYDVSSTPYMVSGCLMQSITEHGLLNCYGNCVIYVYVRYHSVQNLG